ncbi:MAG: NAD(P)/FAD-dependent oxidoreductase, partial [Firmicutes bacterium]|nr:NAD(P)/FAD-dependent oxidoreductase [Bacillota bacterium]
MRGEQEGFSTEELYDLTIVGGGPVGLFAASMAGLHGMKVKIIESLPELGGQLYALYPEKPIYDVAGFPVIAGKDLVAALVAQALRLHPTVCVDEAVETVEEDGEFYRMHTNRGDHLTRTILLSVGIGSFTPRKLPAEGAESWEGRGVYYFVPHLAHFQNKDVIVVGGGDTAVDWALALADIANKVTVIHRRNEFRAQEESVRLMHDHPHIDIRTPCEVQEIYGEEALHGIRIRHAEEGEQHVKADAVIGGLGFHPNLGAIKSWGLDFKGPSIVVAPDSMRTSRPGIFAVGDAVYYPGKVKLIATG